MKDKEKLELAIQCLEKIADIGHAPDCDQTYVPLGECGCVSESAIAQGCLEDLGIRKRWLTLPEDEIPDI